MTHLENDRSGSHEMFYDLLAIGCGGFLGAIARYALSGWMTHRFAEFEPSGTLLVNVIGCLIIGALWGAMWIHPGRFSLFFMTGFLGSLTTFSTFGFQTMHLIKQGHASTALINITANVVLGLAAVWIGFLITSQFFPSQQSTGNVETTVSKSESES